MGVAMFNFTLLKKGIFMGIFMKEFLIDIVLIVGVIGTIFYGMNSYTKYKCSQYQTVTGKPTRYVNFDSCYIKDKGVYERYEVYKMKSVAENLKP